VLVPVAPCVTVLSGRVEQQQAKLWPRAAAAAALVAAAAQPRAAPTAVTPSSRSG